MCGIAGIIDPSGIKVRDLVSMSLLQRHRGPDDEGFLLIDERTFPHAFRGNDTVRDLQALPHIDDSAVSLNATAGFAHRRLSIIDLHHTGHQPMASADGRCFIIYNGEVYNFRELRQELESYGYEFRSQSDTEVILNAYIEWGEQCVERFVGMWAFAVWDSVNRVVFLSRDRFGIKPLYYASLPGTFAFASEIKALLELDWVSRAVDVEMACQYLVFAGQLMPDKTLFEGISELPPGHNVTYAIPVSTYSVSQYYDLRDRVRNCDVPDGDSAPGMRYRMLIEDAVDLHLRSDVPVGSCLSGGIDSSALAALGAQNNAGVPFRTFTAAYNDRAVDESAYAALVASHLQNIEAFYTRPSSSGLWRDMERLVWHHDLPVGSTSIFSQWEVMKSASGHGLKVVLDGQGADESLGGYALDAGIFLLGLLKRGRIFTFASEAQKLRARRSITAWKETGRAAYYLLPPVLQRLADSRVRATTDYLAPRFRKTLENAPAARRVDRSMRMKESGISSISYGLQELLRYEDRNSMAFSIESRVPFLDHRLVEFTLALPEDWKIKDGWSKYVLRKAVENSLPDEVVWRKDKKGFITPQKAWKEELNGKIREYLGDHDFPRILKKEAVIRSCEEVSSDPSRLTGFWRVLLFLKWADRFGVSI